MEKATPILCPYCSAELVQIRLAPAKFEFLAGWTCTNCSPLLSTQRLIGRVLGWFADDKEG